MRFSNSIVLVTGGSQGIGAAIVQAFYEAGATVYFTGRGEEKMKAFVDGLPSVEGCGTARYVVSDVTQAGAAEQVIERIVAEAGRIDVLVNNAGITRDTLLMRMKEEDWNAVIDTNLKGAFSFTKAVVKYMMKQRQGRIVNVSSVVASAGNPGQANYCASKAGLEGLTRSVAREVASRGITVNAVAPGYIVTPMTDVLNDEVKKSLMSTIPAGRLGVPADIAQAVLFLASEGAGYITGHVLHVNGGMYM